MKFYRANRFLLWGLGLALGLASVEIAVAADVPAPTGVRADVVDRKNVKISWNSVAANVGYLVYRGSMSLGATTATGQFDINLPDGEHCYTVQTYDDSKGGARSAMSARVCAVIGSVVVTQPPVVTSLSVPVPTGFRAELYDGNRARVTWNSMGANLGYLVFRGTKSFGATTSTSLYEGNLPNGEHCYTIQAYDDSKGGARSYMSEKACIVVGAVNTPPVVQVPQSNTGVQAPTGVRAELIDRNTARVSWNAVASHVGYLVYRGSLSLGATSATTQAEGNLSAGEHCYTVQTYDDSKGGARSPMSARACVVVGSVATTPAPAPTPTPTAPAPSGGVAAFGCRPGDMSCSGPTIPGCSVNVASWPSATNKGNPVGYDIYTRTYKSNAGFSVVDKINSLYASGQASGLSQEKGRSYDGEHVTLYFAQGYPGLSRGSPLSQYGNPCGDIYQERVTFGWQSYGFSINGLMTAVAERNTRDMVINHHRYGNKSSSFTQDAYKSFYENNFVMAQPAAETFFSEASRNAAENTFARRWSMTHIDRYTFLSPFYLQSIGYSGSDVELLKPIVFASASIPPALKTRMLRQGLLAPTVMTLFKKYIQGDGNLRSPAAHQPAYTLPPEADENAGGAPRLHAMVDAANRLTHIPPVARLQVLSANVTRAGGYNYPRETYMADHVYSFNAALRPGETLTLVVDLGQSWADGQRALSYYSSVLRGVGTIERLNSSGSQIRITIPWMAVSGNDGRRTDVLLLAHDGVYDSAPAYISVRHIQSSEYFEFGL